MRYLIVALTLALAVPAFAAPGASNESPAEFLAARQVFFQARAGDKSATERSLAMFEPLLKANPDQPLYRAYYGSAYCLKARDGWFPFSKLANAETGLDHLTKAVTALGPEHDQQFVADVPVSLETRLVAASTFRTMPSMFNRNQQAKDVLADLLAAPALAVSPTKFRAAVYLEAARSAQKDGANDRMESFARKVIEADPASDAAKGAQDLLSQPKG